MRQSNRSRFNCPFLRSSTFDLDHHPLGVHSAAAQPAGKGQGELPARAAHARSGHSALPERASAPRPATHSACAARPVRSYLFFSN